MYKVLCKNLTSICTSSENEKQILIDRQQAAVHADVLFHNLTTFPGVHVLFEPQGLTGHDQECYLCSESQHTD